jgi:hypothetical protein
MIWLTWRQHRKQVLYTAIALAVLAAVMLPTGLSMHHVFTDSGLAACLAKVPTAPVISANVDTCGTLSGEFSRQFNSMGFIAILFLILPVLVGLFYGAPLVAREVEHGTHRFVWTQGVSRRRWAATEFGLIGAITLVFAIAYALGIDWWSGPLITNGGRMGQFVFDFEGIAPIAYTLFAVALGVLVGAVSRKVLPAMGVTLAGYAVVRVVIEVFARPRYQSPLAASFPITSNDLFNTPGAWTYSQGIINGAGKLVQPNDFMTCGSPTGGAGACGDQLVQQGLGPAPFSNWQQYQPASRFWEFQGIETGIFLALAAILVYLTFRRIRGIS